MLSLGSAASGEVDLIASILGGLRMKDKHMEEISLWDSHKDLPMHLGSRGPLEGSPCLFTYLSLSLLSAV